jgi:hypothetical protein
MTDTINKACAVLSKAIQDQDQDQDRFELAAPGDARLAKARRNDEMATKCEAALADLRLMASGDERFK